jgi:ATP-binding cassette, subfamily B, bacterial HlyB/CyaB
MHDVKTKPADTGLAALVMLMRFQGVAAEPDQIRHRFGGAPIGLTEMLRCAKDFGLKARVVKTGWARLAKSPLPAIGCLGSGGFLLVGKASDDPVLVSDPSVGRPEMLSRAAFEERWDGRIVFMARRANLSDLTNRFGISWFVTAIHKYRLLIG